MCVSVRCPTLARKPGFSRVPKRFRSISFRLSFQPNNNNNFWPIPSTRATPGHYTFWTKMMGRCRIRHVLVCFVGLLLYMGCWLLAYQTTSSEEGAEQQRIMESPSLLQVPKNDHLENSVHNDKLQDLRKDDDAFSSSSAVWEASKKILPDVDHLAPTPAITWLMSFGGSVRHCRAEMPYQKYKNKHLTYTRLFAC